MKKLKNALYAGAGLSLLAINSVSAAIDPGKDKVNDGIEWSTETADVVIQTWITRLMTFLAIIAVIFALWGGFNILTAAWDEEKVKKGKTVLINAIIWLVVIFLAGSIIGWVLRILVWS